MAGMTGLHRPAEFVRPREVQVVPTYRAWGPTCAVPGLRGEGKAEDLRQPPVTHGQEQNAGT